MNGITVALMLTTVVIAFAQDWPASLKVWVQGKVAETQTGQTKT